MKISTKGDLLYSEPMSRHTTWRVGGPAEYYYQPADSDDLVNFLTDLDSTVPLFLLGLGSNLLVRDGGIDGVVIATAGRLNDFKLLTENLIRVEVGVPCAIVARKTVNMNLSGAEFLAGIPGTMGGALAMNAGAFGGETWSIVECVETIDRKGRIRCRNKDDFEIGYRFVHGANEEWFLAAHLRLSKNQSGLGKVEIKELLKKRSLSQPTKWPSCGSVFKNPENHFAAKLIEESGLKGKKIGGAQVSEKHANFIINLGDAKASDIEALMNDIIETVNEKFNIKLQSEVHVIGKLLDDPK